MKNPCKECVYYHKENNTCQSKKAATSGYGYVTFWDRLMCEPNRGVRKDESTMGQLNPQEAINEVEKL